MDSIFSFGLDFVVDFECSELECFGYRHHNLVIFSIDLGLRFKWLHMNYIQLVLRYFLMVQC